MSQYLSHLANLAFNQLDVVQPRLNSRFEGNSSTNVADTSGAYTSMSGVANPNALAEAASNSVDPSTARHGYSFDDGNTSELVDRSSADEGRSAQISTRPRQSQLASLSASDTTSAASIQPLEKVEQISLNSLASRSSTKSPTSIPSGITQASAATSASTGKLTSTRNSGDSFQEQIVGARQLLEAWQLLDTRQPLLQPIELGSEAGSRIAPSQAVINSGFGDKSGLAQVAAKFNQEFFQGEFAQGSPIKTTLSAQHRESTPVTPKTKSSKPETINIKPLAFDVAREQAVSQPFAATPVDITPPTINVSIGRIEIRATQSNQPSAPAAKSRAASTMSLDDYLKQRNGERS